MKVRVRVVRGGFELIGNRSWTLDFSGYLR